MSERRTITALLLLLLLLQCRSPTATFSLLVTCAPLKKNKKHHFDVAEGASARETSCGERQHFHLLDPPPPPAAPKKKNTNNCHDSRQTTRQTVRR